MQYVSDEEVESRFKELFASFGVNDFSIHYERGDGYIPHWEVSWASQERLHSRIGAEAYDLYKEVAKVLVKTVTFNQDTEEITETAVRWCQEAFDEQQEAIEMEWDIL